MPARKAVIGAGAALAVLVLAGAGVLGYRALNGSNVVASVAEIGAPFELIDDDGNPITEKAFLGHPNLLYFGFTRCPEVCPTTLYEMAGWLNTLGDEGKDIRAFFVSVDPERDTPEIMKGYAEAFTDRVTGITGDPAKVEALLKAWRVYHAKVPTEDGDYTMDHTASVFLVDPQGHFQGTISYGEQADVALQKIRNLLAKS